MQRNRRLFAVLLAALMVASVASIGGAALGQSPTPTDAPNSAQTAQTNASNETDGSLNETESSGWTSPRADAGRTGATTDPGPLPYGFDSWRIGEEGHHDWGPVVTGETVIMAYDGDESPDGVVEAYSDSIGDPRWEQTQLGEPTGPASVADGRVFVATIDDVQAEGSDGVNESGLYALSASDGEVLWRVNDTRSAPVVVGDRVFTSHQPSESFPPEESDYGTVAAHDAATGDRIWTSDVRGQVVAYADGRLFVTNEQSDTLSALDPADGSLLWQTTVDEDVYLEDKLAATGEAVYFTNDAPEDGPLNTTEASPKRVTAFAAADGARTWTANLTTEFGTNPHLVSAPAVTNGTVYVVSDDDFGPDGQEVGTVHALDAETGAEEWTFGTRASLRSDPAVANGTLYVGGRYEWNSSWIDSPSRSHGTEYIVVFALDAADGSETWNLMTGLSLDESDRGPNAAAVAAAHDPDGHLYLTVQRQTTPFPGTEIIAFESKYVPQQPTSQVLEDEPRLQNATPNAVIDASPPPNDEGYYEANATVTLNASASSDLDGEIVSYEWDVDGDGEFEQTGQTIEVTTAAEACEVVTVTLRVTDDEGATDETTVTLQTEP